MEMAQYLYQSYLFFTQREERKNDLVNYEIPILIVCWEHKNIPKIVHQLLNLLHTNQKMEIPNHIPTFWNDNDFQSLWILHISPSFINFEKTTRDKILQKSACHLL